jgi:RNA polymerase sigma-70 factor (ECF subfamily)
VDYSTLSALELVRVCLQTGAESAWVEFVRRFQPLIAGVVVRMARRWGETSPDVLDDLIQEAYLKLCTDRQSMLDKFHPKHPDAIFGYIKVCTANLVHDHFKAVHAKKRGGAIVNSGDGDQEANWASSTSDVKSIERAVLIGQIDACLRNAESGPNVERDRRIFWLYYRTGLPASAIAALPTVALTTKGVESTLLRLTRQVRERLAPPEHEVRAEDASRKGIQAPESL